ncbi:heterokaryon incompatibility, partial [Phaeosphaeriaceae sp. PMI808]
YVALSHCWGTPEMRPVTTTTDNISAHMSSIKFEKLPLSFQDAVIVTWKLGFQYLWIDSLCIIQNDADDWKREAVRMASVYGNASVTIAASHAHNSSYGLLLQRSEADSCITLDLPPPSSHVQKEKLFFSFPGNARHFRTSLQFAPLRTRGWCLQEEALSRRILWFTDGEVIWQC